MIMLGSGVYANSYLHAHRSLAGLELLEVVGAGLHVALGGRQTVCKLLGVSFTCATHAALLILRGGVVVVRACTLVRLRLLLLLGCCCWLRVATAASEQVADRVADRRSDTDTGCRRHHIAKEA